MKVLALCPYHGGSHERFLTEWQAHSSHTFEIVSLPARHFKWRMRQAAVGLSQMAQRLVQDGQSFDVWWTTSLCNVAELRGLLPPLYSGLPGCTYFHENQLVYPSRSSQRDQERGWDINLPLSNWTSCLASDACWFNSEFNLRSLKDGLTQLLGKMPDERSLETLSVILQKSSVQPPGINYELFRAGADHKDTAVPLTIAWVGRWEHDKRPDLFFAALSQLKDRNVAFQLVCLGQQFQQIPAEFERARQQLTEHIVHFGHATERVDYAALLSRCDVVVSTAEHEFFGIALLEAVAAGCVPLVPHRQVYPDLYPQACLYLATTDEETVTELAIRLEQLAGEKTKNGTLLAIYHSWQLDAFSSRYDWSRRAQALDHALAQQVISRQTSNGHV